MKIRNNTSLHLEKNKAARQLFAVILAVLLLFMKVAPAFAADIGAASAPSDNNAAASSEPAPPADTQPPIADGGELLPPGDTAEPPSPPADTQQPITDGGELLPPGDTAEPPSPPADTQQPITDGGVLLPPGDTAEPPSPPADTQPPIADDALLRLPAETMPPEPLSFSAEIITEGEQQGLYITLHHVPQGLSQVRVQYSFGGLEYALISDKMWENVSSLADDTGNVTLLCYAIGEHPLDAYLSEAVNSLYVQVLYYIDETGGGELTPVRFSHDKTYALPETPPPFTAEFQLGWFSHSVIGHFTDFMPNVAKVRSTYSWDGTTYQYCNPEAPDAFQFDLQNMGMQDEAARNRLENQEVASNYAEPLSSFLAGEQDSFYLRLEITNEDQEVYYSQAAYMSREDFQPLPERLTPRIALDFDIAVMEARNDNGNEEDDDNYYAELVKYTYGEIQLTVQADAVWEEIETYLPDTVPVRITFWDKNTKEKYAFGKLSCEVKWKKPPAFSMTPGEPLIIENMAEPLVIPADTEVKTSLGTYILRKPLTFQSRYDSDDIRLVLNPIAAQDEPNVVLRESQAVNAERNSLSLAFWNKPCGAASIKAYAAVDGVRTEICDLLDRRSVNHNLSHPLYGYIDLLQADEAPYQDYLNGEIDHFSIDLSIEGGVYDGKEISLLWPQEYELPAEIYDPYGMEGQENNAGNSYEEIEEGDDSNGGLHPGIPEEDKPPTVVLPPPGSEQPGDGSQISPPEEPTPPEEPVPPKKQAQPKEPVQPEEAAQPEEPVLSEKQAQTEEAEQSVQETQSKRSNPSEVPANSDRVISQSIPENSVGTTLPSEQETITVPPAAQAISPPTTAQLKHENPKSDRFPISLVAGVLILGTAGTIAAALGAPGTAGVTAIVRKCLAALKNLFIHRS